MQRFAVIHSNHPCTELVLDVKQVIGYLIRAGFAETPEPADADVVIVSTCAFNQDYEDSAVASVERVKAMVKPDATILVTGCLSKINPERFALLGDVTALPPRDMATIEALFPAEVRLVDVPSNTVTVDEYESNRLFMLGIRLKRLFRALPFVGVPRWLDTVPMSDWFFIRGAVGCTGTCAYCAIKRARGNVTSTPPDTIVAQVHDAVRHGYREISLAGDDMGCYGSDIGTDLAELLTAMLGVGDDFVVNLRFVEPAWLIRLQDKLMPIFETGRITSFCVPLQTGSQRLLDAMRRDYRADDAVRVVNEVLQKTKVRSISSNCMVGFPGETTDDFALSYRLLETCDINMYQVLEYQDRPGTAATAMPDKIADDVKRRRRARFITKMQLVKFVGLPYGPAERWARFRHGPLV